MLDRRYCRPYQSSPPPPHAPRALWICWQQRPLPLTNPCQGMEEINLMLPPAEALNQPEPFNPVAALPNKLVKRILNLDFVDRSEVSVEDDSFHSTGRPHPARLPITSIFQWLERFSMMAAIIVTCFPLKAPELLVYQSLIVRAQHNYEGEQWIAYDRQFRREALAGGT